MSKSDYDDFKSMPINDLADEAAGHGATGSRIELAKLVYNQRLIELQHKHAKQQIELQHKLNTELSLAQTKVNKSFLRITVIATISAAILGAIVGGIAQFAIPLLFQSHSKERQPKTSQSHIESSKLDAVNEKKPVKFHSNL